MNCRLRNAALLLLILVLGTGLVMAQPGLKVTESDGSTFNYTPSAVSAKVPSPGPTGPDGLPRYKYWDALGSSNSGTDYYNFSQAAVTAPPNPQIAAGPDDILVVVNKTIARYPNPNVCQYYTNVSQCESALGLLAANPYNYAPTHHAFLETWVGATAMDANCPTLPRNANTCIIDNTSIRYDQMQGRFVVLFTMTDTVARVSNWVLVVSNFANFACSTTGNPSSTQCASTMDLFTPPIVATVGGPSTGGVNGNWTLTSVPINVTLPFATTVTTIGGITVANSSTLTGPGCNPGSATRPVVAGCSNYLPTNARMGIDNDNIILTAPVLDLSRSSTAPTAQNPTPANYGPYAGTRVTTVPKLFIYTGRAPVVTNIADDTATGTLTGCTNVTAGAAGPLAPQCPAVNPVPVAVPGFNPVPNIFWEPDNLRGRALASFNTVIGPVGTSVAGVVSPIDYLVGTRTTDLYGAETASGDPHYYIQPVVFGCPGVAIFGGPLGVIVCGDGQNGGQIADAPLLGPIQINIATLATVSDPSLVGQGGASSAPSGGTIAAPQTKNRLFVGDSRPQQVIFREGLAYVARTVRLYDSAANTVGTSTVMYNLIRQSAPGVATAGGITTVTITPPASVLETEWFTGSNAADPNGFGFYAPMFDVPANVIQSGSISPISLFPWLEKLFVGMTASDTPNVAGTFPPTGTACPPTAGGCANDPSLWDFRPGDDAFDTTMPYLDPVTGTVITTITAQAPNNTAGAQGNTFAVCTQASPCPMIPFGSRGGASTDPNDGSLWLYGSFAKKRLTGIVGPGVWGTSVANYALSFPAVDPYNNDNAFFADVPPTDGFFTWIQIAKNLGIAGAKSTTTATGCIVPPSTGNNGGGQTPSAPCSAGIFGSNDNVTRAEMSYWIVRSQMDEAQIGRFLVATGGDPGAGATCTANSFADVPPCPGATLTTFPLAPLPAGSPVISDSNRITRYIEVMSRRGYTKGCITTNDARRRFCPNDLVTRGQMGVFIIRAKMNNVFPTSLSGIPISNTFGDNFGTFLGTFPNAVPGVTGGAYFSDEASSDDFFIYIQKMRELRISNGTSPISTTAQNTYSPAANVTRAQMATFIVRAFFL